MPIAGYKPTVDLPTEPNLPKVQPDNYKTVTYDEKHKPLHGLLAYVEGAVWSTQAYYSQVVNKHNDLREVDTAQSGTFQQYHKIVNLEIRVSSALTNSYDQNTSITTVTGAGFIYPFIIPNVADYFVSDTADNQKALFRITSVERRSINVDSVYAVEFELVNYYNQNPQLFDNLEAKTIRKYFFNKDRLIEGINPLLKDEDNTLIRSLSVDYRNIAKYYFKTFFNRDHMSLVIPGQEYAIYDHYLVQYLLSIVDTTDAPEIKSLVLFPSDNDDLMIQSQFFKLMYYRDYEALPYCNKQMGLLSTKGFNRSPYLYGLFFHSIDYVIYPKVFDESTHLEDRMNCKVISDTYLVDTKSANGTEVDYTTQQYITETKSFQIVKGILEHDHYVLSPDFYNNTENQTVLEILTKDYLKGNSIDLRMLAALVGKVMTWNRLEQYYYIPIILTLIKEAYRSTYS